MSLIPCRGCRRHIEVGEIRCPFCRVGAVLSGALVVAPLLLSSGVARAADAGEDDGGLTVDAAPRDAGKIDGGTSAPVYGQPACEASPRAEAAPGTLLPGVAAGLALALAGLRRRRRPST